jgi:hypothetical protein
MYSLFISSSIYSFTIYLFIAKILAYLQPATSNEFLMFNDEDVRISVKQPT